MIQDIGAKEYKCEFKKKYPKLTDVLLFIKDRNILMKKNDKGYSFPTFADTNISKYFNGNIEIDENGWKGKVRKLYPDMEMYRTISVDKENYYIVDVDEIFKKDINLELVSNEILRHYNPNHMSFAVATASQIARWQKSNKYCGKCGSKMHHSDVERSMVCAKCNNMVYPKICPAVTIAITHKGKILLVRNNGGAFRKYALVAGYVEVGETFEDTVRREAMEEVGIKVKNIKYYKNQPWAMTDAHMIGYTAEVDGDDTIHMQVEELQDARWFSADEIPHNITSRSLTYEMIKNFREENIEKSNQSDEWKKHYNLFDVDMEK